MEWSIRGAGEDMRYLRYMALLAVLVVPLAYSQAQVSVGVGIGYGGGYGGYGPGYGWTAGVLLRLLSLRTLCVRALRLLWA